MNNRKLPRKPNRKFCAQGHPWIEDNLYIHNGIKECLVCKREYAIKKNRERGIGPPIRRTTHCKEGHLLIEGNIRGGKSRNKGKCLLCHRFRESKHFKKEARAYIEIILKDPCVYCGNTSTEIDHIEPRIKGGSHEWDNLAPVCKVCNTRKHKRGVLIFMLDKLNNPLSLPEKKRRNIPHPYKRVL
jgi:5-methylcytosine-specific restriction endonuclease McrA